MTNHEIINQLEDLHDKMKRKGMNGHSEYLANETGIIASSAIRLMKAFDSGGVKEVEDARARALEYLHEANHFADLYYSGKKDPRKRENPDVPDYKFITPTFNGIELFLHTVQES